MTEDIIDRLSGKVPTIERGEHGYRGRIGAPGADNYFTCTCDTGSVDGNRLYLTKSSSFSGFDLNDEALAVLRDVVVRHCEDKGL